MNVVNDSIPIEAWNTILFQKFVRFQYVLTQGLSDHSDKLFRRYRYPPGTRVLDIGFSICQGKLFVNIRSALVPGGKLSMIVWRRREDNPWIHTAELRVREIVPVVSPSIQTKSIAAQGLFNG